MDLPEFVQIEPVGQCNLRCRMCPIAFRGDGPPDGRPAFMAFEAFTRLIDQFAGAAELHLQGLGEPMMHPRLFDMVEHATARGLRVSINTNLTLLNSARAERCVASGLDTVHVSVDGATAATYEAIRLRGHFDRVERNLELLHDARRRLGSDRPHVRLVMVVMRRNLHELPELVRMARGWAVSSLFVQHLCHDFGESSLPDAYLPMRDFVRAETLLGEDQSRIAEQFARARQRARELGVGLRLPRTRPRAHPPGTPGPSRCDWPWARAYLSYQGLAMPCCMVATPDRIHFGSMADRGVESIWNGAPYEAFRRRLASDDPPEVCRSCSLYHGVF